MFNKTQGNELPGARPLYTLVKTHESAGHFLMKSMEPPPGHNGAAGHTPCWESPKQVAHSSWQCSTALVRQLVLTKISGKQALSGTVPDTTKHMHKQHLMQHPYNACSHPAVCSGNLAPWRPADRPTRETRRQRLDMQILTRRPLHGVCRDNRHKKRGKQKIVNHPVGHYPAQQQTKNTCINAAQLNGAYIPDVVHSPRNHITPCRPPKLHSGMENDVRCCLKALRLPPWAGFLKRPAGVRYAYGWGSLPWNKPCLVDTHAGKTKSSSARSMHLPALLSLFR